jgi:amidase
VLSHADWIRSDRIRNGQAARWRELFRQFDVVVCPVMPTAAFPHDHSDFRARRIDIDGTPHRYSYQAVWAGVATLTGQPATAIPLERSDQGLPVGVQIVGPYLEDRTTLAFAALAEREFGGFVAPPGYAG